MQNIAKDSGIALGSLAYYFKKKEDIAALFLRDYIDKIYEYILLNTYKKINTYYLHTIASIPYYKNMIEDPNTKVFYHELLKGGALHVDTHAENPFKESMNLIGTQIAYEYHHVYNDFNKKSAFMFNIAGRNMMLLKLLEGEFNDVPIEYVINFISCSVGQVLGVPADEINTAIDMTIEFNEEYDLSHIQVLK